MLVFIIPLRSRAVSHDWQKVSALCARTVASCCRQNGGKSHTILVCREAPSLPVGLNNLTVIEEPFPIPEDKQAQMTDKYRKIQRGLIHARAMSPFYWMKVDADDCVSNRLAGYIGSQPHSPGWLFEKGWVHSENRHTIFLYRRGFFRVCGTSSILNYHDTKEYPGSMAEPLSQFPYLNTAHNELDRLAVERGEPLKTLPFPGAVYCAGTGENWSGFGGVHVFRSKKWALRRLLNTRLVTCRLREEFGLTPLTVSTVTDLS